MAEQLRRLHPDLNVELVEIKTQGDRDRNSPLAAIGGSGLFTKEIQRAVRDGSVDIAVHSLKDLPTQTSRRSTALRGASPRRYGRCTGCAPSSMRTLEALPRAARVGTAAASSARSQLLFLRPDLEIVSLRGNVETRLNQALEGQLDAVVLAWAGLERLGLETHITQRLAPPDFLPAVGQGALGLECRREDEAVVTLIKPLNDAVTHRAILAERTALAALEGGCNLPMAAWARDVIGNEAEEEGPALAIDAAVFDPDGRDRIFVTLKGPRNDPEALGSQAAQYLLDHGAKPLLAR